MAEEVQYSSLGRESNKRKFKDSPQPPALVPRRASRFSSPPVSASTPDSYNSVPPQMSDIESVKQKALEIAARISMDINPPKRVKVGNGKGDVRGGNDSSDYSSQKAMGSGFSGQPQYTSSGYPGTSKKIEIPSVRVGDIIGRGGDTREAEQLINETLSEVEVGGTGGGSRRMIGQAAGSEQFVMKVANNKVGLVIGEGGEPIKSMQVKTGARIQVIPLHLPRGDRSKERTIQIDGTSDQIEAARQLVEEVTSENQPRNSSISGGYPQQGYQGQPQNNWGPPMQQPNYGYAQPGPRVSQIQSAANQNCPLQSVYAGYGLPQTQKPPSGQLVYGQPGYPQSAETSQGPPESYPVFQTGYGGVQPHQQFKSFLQQFAGKKHYNLPVYTTRTEGPAHSRRFKSSVSVNGKSYETAKFFTTLKEAEQAAAKVACQELLVDAISEDGDLHKNLLRELAREKGLMLPKYECVKSGLLHAPLFVYTVEIGNHKIQGPEAKTKKLAELKAARAAYYALME